MPLGIIAGGIAFNYYMENFDGVTPHPILKLSQYPLPLEQIKFLYNKCEQVLILEEGYPYLEEHLHDYFTDSQKVIGKLTGHIKRTGELNPDVVGMALGKEKPTIFSSPAFLKNRPPQLCDGCSHVDTFNALNEVKKIIGNKQIFGDIGCYALGALPPFETISTLIDMGASITMAKGAADAGVHPSIAVIGDSTFTHSGMTGLLDCVNNNTPVTVIISDNSAVAMTGGQNSSAMAKLKNICLGIGVEPEHVRVIEPLPKNHDKNVKAIKEELDYKGVSVIIAQRACVRLPVDRKKEAKALALNHE